MSDLAQVAAMAEANWKPANQYWKERAEKSEHKIERLERELAEYRRIRFMKADAKFTFISCDFKQGEHENVIQTYQVGDKSIATINLNGFAITSPERIDALKDELAAEKALADWLYSGGIKIGDGVISCPRDAYRKARGL